MTLALSKALLLLTSAYHSFYKQATRLLEQSQTCTRRLEGNSQTHSFSRIVYIKDKDMTNGGQKHKSSAGKLVLLSLLVAPIAFPLIQ
jgi:hypothetical protein